MRFCFGVYLFKNFHVLRGPSLVHEGQNITDLEIDRSVAVFNSIRATPYKGNPSFNNTYKSDIEFNAERERAAESRQWMFFGFKAIDGTGNFKLSAQTRTVEKILGTRLQNCTL